MGFFKGYPSKTVCNTIHIKSNSEHVWKEITQVMINKSSFPILLSILGIPKPLKAQVIKEGIGGYTLNETTEGLTLKLSSDYRLNGVIGYLFHLPFRIVVYRFQKHLLKAIEANC